MRVVVWDFVFATWLLVSSFLFPRTPWSVALTAGAAVAVVLLALIAVARPGARYLIAVIAFGLAFVALAFPDMSGLARINDALVAAILCALSLVSPAHRHAEGATMSPART